jgi:hypothetical protein
MSATAVTEGSLRPQPFKFEDLKEDAMKTLAALLQADAEALGCQFNYSVKFVPRPKPAGAAPRK